MNTIADTERIRKRISIVDEFEPERGSLQWVRGKTSKSKPGSKTIRGGPIQSSNARRRNPARARPGPVQFAAPSPEDKHIRFNEFDRLIHQRQREREEQTRQARKRAAARTSRVAIAAAVRPPRVISV